MSIVICNPCDRTFINQTSLEQHYKYSSAHEWCERCSRAFNSIRAKEQHLTNSSKHHRCHLCAAGDRPDFRSYADLNSHLKSLHCYCPRCFLHLHFAWRLEEHDVAKHNLCLKCGQYFNSPQNLRAHGLTHMPKQIECFGCDELFVTTSAMILHLESGYCSCQLDSEGVTQLAMECLDPGYYRFPRREHRSGFKCKGCGSNFNLISGLLQHVESNCCIRDGGVNDGALGKFQEYLKRNI